MPRVEIERARGGLPTRTAVPQARALPVADTSGSFEAFADVLQEQKRQQDVSYVTEARIKASEEVALFKQNFDNNIESADGYTQAYIEQVDTIYDKYLQDAPSIEARNVLSNQFGSLRVGEFNSAVNQETKLRDDMLIQSSQDSLNSLSNTIYMNPGSLDQRVQDMENIKDSASLRLNPAEQEKFNDQVDKAVFSAFINGTARTNPAEAREIVESGRFNEIFNAEETGRLLNSINSYQRDLDSNVKKQAEKAYDGFLDELNLKIFNRETSQGELDQLLQSGQFRTNADYIKMSNALEARLKKDESQVNAIALINNSIDTGLGLDPGNREHRDAVDEYYEGVIKETVTSENFAEVMTNFVGRVGVLPTEVKSNVITSLYSNSPTAAVESARIISNNVRTQPKMARQFTDDDIARAITISSTADVLTPEKALEAGQRQLFERNTPEYKLRVQQFKDQGIEFDEGQVTQFFRNDPGEVPTGMLSDFNNLVYTLSVDNMMPFDTAQEAAYGVINARWKVTSINGEPEWMKEPPEFHYGVAGLSEDDNREWMRLQINDEVDQELPEDFRMVRTNLRSANPEYEIHWTDPNTSIPRIVVDDRGRPLLYTPDASQSQFVADKIKKNKELIDKRVGRKQIEQEIRRDPDQVLEEGFKRRFP